MPVREKRSHVLKGTSSEACMRSTSAIVDSVKLKIREMYDEAECAGVKKWEGKSICYASRIFVNNKGHYF